MRPRLIRSELGDGSSTWLPYGLSVDTSAWERELLERAEQLVVEHQAGNGDGHARAPAATSGARARRRR